MPIPLLLFFGFFLLIFAAIVGSVIYQLTLPKKKFDHGFGQIQTVTYFKNKRVMLDEWHLNGRRHRPDDQPAVTEYYKDGRVKEEKWYLHGVKHREGDQPASREYYRNGQLEEEEWCVNGVKHRDGDQPAEIEYSQDGQVREREWYVNGRYVRQEKNSNY